MTSSGDTWPVAHGYAMPAEWAPHRATWIAWPHERSDWPGKFAPVPWVYVEIVRHLSRVERVNILVEGRKQGREVLWAVVLSVCRSEPSLEASFFAL